MADLRRGLGEDEAISMLIGQQGQDNATRSSVSKLGAIMTV